MISLRDAPTSTQLRTYLNDHLAASKGGIELAKRCLGSNQGTELARYLETFLREVTDERQDLRRLMSRLGFPEAQPKVIGAVLAERIGRVKLNGQLLGYSDLSRLVELEGLTAGVRAKMSMWESLQSITDEHPVIAETIDPDGLRDDALRQLEELKEQRRIAARRAFT